MSKRGRDRSGFDLEALAKPTDGLQRLRDRAGVVSALYTAAMLDGDVTTHLLLREVGRTHPLSRTMAERIDTLRRWASGRTVSAR